MFDGRNVVVVQRQFRGTGRNAFQVLVARLSRPEKTSSSLYPPIPPGQKRRLLTITVDFSQTVFRRISLRRTNTASSLTWKAPCQTTFGAAREFSSTTTEKENTLRNASRNGRCGTLTRNGRNMSDMLEGLWSRDRGDMYG